MKRLAVIAASSASAIAMSASASFADYTLNILHINDWHSRIESINRFDSTCSAEDETAGECFGGAARLVTAAKERREALDGENVVFLNAGDNFQGSLFYTTYKGTAEAEFLNQMGTDAMVIGNHEFDDGEDALSAFLDAIEFPALGANISVDDMSVIGDKIEPYTVLEVGGERIGIVGAVANDTAELSSPGEHVSIEEDVASITEAVEAVAGEGVNKIIALTHVGYPRDLEAIAKIPGVDVVVGGHTNTLLSNTVEGAVGPYPTWVDNPDGYRVPVVQAYAYSKYLGELKVTFDDEGVVEEASGDLMALDASVTPDETVLARIQELGAPIEELKNKVVAETSAPIDGSRESCRAMECEMGVLVTDAMLDRTADQGVTIAITNGGGLRASIDQGPVTMGEVLTVLPFQNTLATFQLSGEDIVASLESGVSQIEEGAGRFPQVAGLRYSFDKSAAAGEGRIQSVEVMEDGQWVPIDPSATYTVATNNFMRNGGDGYALFASNGQNAYDFGPPLDQVVADYLAENQPYQPKTEGRISEVMAQAEPEEPMEEEEAMPEEDMAEEPAEEAEAMPEEDMAEEPAEEAEAMPEEDMAEEPAEEAETMPEDDMAEEPAEEAEAMPEEDMAEEPAEEAEAMPEEDMAEEPAEEAEAMPEEDMAEDDMADEAGPRTHVVVAGDNFWDLAERYYGDGSKWRMIADANPDASPDALTIGMSLTIPPAE